MVKKIIEKKAKEATELAQEARNRVFLAIAAAFSFVIALTWNEAIKEGINKIIISLGITGAAYIYKILTAVIITIICVIGIMIASKWTRKKS